MSLTVNIWKGFQDGWGNKLSQKEVSRYLKWGRPIIVENLGEDTFSVFCRETGNEFARLQLAAPKFRQSINKTNFRYGVFGLSIYRALVNEFGFKKERAAGVLTEIMCEVAKQVIEHSLSTRFFLSNIAKFKPLKSMMERSMFSLSEQDGWFIRKAESEAYLAVDIRQCGLVKWLGEQGAPEICSAFCETDYVTAKYMKGLRFVRTKTLANGDSICDFRYFKENKKQ